MDEAAFTVVVGVIPTAASLLVRLLLYNLAFRKKSRMRGNTYTWLITVGFGIVLEIIMAVIFKEALGLRVIGMYFYVPLVGIAVPSLWALIRFIYIKATPKKERIITQKTPEPVLE